MNQGKTNESGSFSAAFSARIDNLIQRSKAAGLNVTKLCKETGIARATPERWIKRPPLSIQLVDKMEEAVVRAEQAATQQ